MKVWITKYALTIGIIDAVHVDDTPRHEGLEQAYFWDENKQLNNNYYIPFEELFYDKDSAIVKAEEMRQKKIASLKKQIEKLEQMKFG